MVAFPVPVLSVPFSSFSNNYNETNYVSQLVGANLTAVGSTLFGTAGLGYNGGNGVIFSINPDGSGLTICIRSAALTAMGKPPCRV